MFTLNNRLGGNLISVLKVPRKAVLSYGVMVPGANDGGITQVTGLVVKPKVEGAPSNLTISGRYILQPDVMLTLENEEKGAGDEIQLADAMAWMIGTQPFHTVTFAGKRYYCGSKAGYVEANLTIALGCEDMGAKIPTFALDLLAN